MASRIVGLDFGRDTIRAVEVENADKPRPLITRYAEIPVPNGAVRSGEVRETQTITTAVKRLWSSGGFTSKNVVLGMANQRVIVRDLTLPRMSLRQIRESLPFQVQDMLPVPVSEALLDFYPVSEATSEHGPVVNGLLVAAIKESVLTNVMAVRGAGLNVVDVDLIPFALSRAIVRGPAAHATVVLVDVGATTTNIVVTAGGVPQFVRMIPLGGQSITDALRARLDITEDQAESLKIARGLGSEPATSELDYASIEVIRATALELLNSIRNTLNFFSSTRPADSFEALVLSGGGARLSGLARAFGEMFRLPVVESAPFDTVDTAKSVKKDSSEAHRMTIALGLALGSAA